MTFVRFVFEINKRELMAGYMGLATRLARPEINVEIIL